MTSTSKKRLPFVAVIITRRDEVVGGRPVDRSERPHSKYDILVGRLDSKVFQPVDFELVDVDEDEIDS